MEKPTATETLEMMSARREALFEEVGKAIIGQRTVIEQMMIALLSRGHVLLIGVPGLGKTLLVSTVAKAVDLKFSRVQFTPDLMPSDITGTQVIQEDPISKKRTFEFIPGPLFANVILADEINRTPPKTQAALLQAMQENEITSGNETHALERPFWVLATQNPIEQEGTYPLPEAQLDRFMLSVTVTYPSLEDEVRMVEQTTSQSAADLKPVLTAEQILELQELVRGVVIAPELVQTAVRLVAATRPAEGTATEMVRRFVRWGAGPRASQFVVLGAKARAFLYGKMHVDNEDIRAVAPAILRHRLVVNFHAESEGIDADALVGRLMEELGV